MRRVQCGLLVLLLLVAGSASALSAAADQGAFAPIATLVETEIQAGRIPGAVVLIGRHGEVVYRRAFGQRQPGLAAEPMTIDTMFDLASLTKVVATTPAILQLVARGKLSLDAPVARYWPEFAANGKAGISVRQLLTHTSGLPAGLPLDRSWSDGAGALRRIAALRPRAPPGQQWLYSDVNFIVLGELVQRLSDQPLQTYCQRRIFRPLGMSRTGFLPPAAWWPRLAPTGAGPRGRVHDPLAARMGGVAGHAGLFSTADDLALFAQALLDGGGGVLTPAAVRQLDTPQAVPAGAPAQGLGWRLGALPSAATLSHLGYTGTALWIDPPSQTYVIVLTNRVLAGARGDAGPLRRAIIAQVAEQLTPSPGLAQVQPIAPAGVVLPGIDTLATRDFAPLRGRRIGLITNQTGVNLAGRRSLDVLRQVQNLTLAALFSPEHGLAGTANERIANDIDVHSGLVVYSLYGKTLRPTPAMLAGLDALVFDIQDAGTRYYTYLTTLGYAMEAAAARGIPFYVLDRPDPLTADAVQGPPLDADLRSFTGYFSMPVRYGMTIGEVARMFNGELRIGAQLHVVPMSGYRRGDWYDATGLPWIAPSPNLPSLTAATLYPAVGLIEGANVSVGRGTPAPFELLGAPWIDGAALGAYLAQRTIAGVAFAPTNFTPMADRFRGQTCHGVRITLIDRQALDAPALGVELASALHRLYPQRFRLGDTLGLVGSRQVLAAISTDTDPRTIVAGWQDAVAAFEKQRARYLLYH